MFLQAILIFVGFRANSAFDSLWDDFFVVVVCVMGDQFPGVVVFDHFEYFGANQALIILVLQMGEEPLNDFLPFLCKKIF